MSTSNDHEVQIHYEQLTWIDYRRLRIIDSVSAHFDKNKVCAILTKEQLPLTKILHEKRYQDRLGSVSPEELIKKLAKEILQLEAKTISCLRKNITAFKNHVEEQIIFGAKNAGQDAGRQYLSQTCAGRSYSELSLAELVHAILTLHFHGSSTEKDCFLSLRPLSDATIHYRNCPYTQNWPTSAEELYFYSEMQSAWIHGMIEVLSPNIRYQSLKSIAKGHEYGLETFTIS